MTIDQDVVRPAPTFREAVATWAKIGCLSFGGPAGQIAMMHRVLVEEKKWLGEQTYLTALNFCMLLPGPEAMQLATYAGWRLHGLIGGLAAGLLFVLPGACLMMVLALAYAAFGKLPVAEALFAGIKAAVLAIVVEALLRISKRALRGRTDWLIAAFAFLAIFAFGVAFPVIVMAAGIFGYMRRLADVPAAGQSVERRAPAPVAFRQTLATVLVWLAIWIVPLLLVALAFGREHVLTEIGWFFSKLAVVTFGGAYAVLAYMAQAAVQQYGWLEPGEMLDALGLAETTPGPLILVNQFVAVLAGWRHGGGQPIWMGVLGGVVALWATFAPCFLWIFAGAPYIEQLNANPRLKSALAAITAAVVGVIMNLTVWFALHVLFARVTEGAWGPLMLHVPELASIRVDTLALSVLAFVLLFGFHRGIATTLAVTGALALAWYWV